MSRHAAAIGLLLALPAWAFGANAKLLNIQGCLSNASGGALSGPVTVTFRLYANAGDAVSSALWTESQVLSPNNCSFNAVLGQGTALDPIAFNRAYYLGIQVAGDSGEVQPRQLLGASAFALGSLGDFDIGNNLAVKGKIKAAGLVGTATTGNADPGNVGEYVMAKAGSGVPAASGHFKNIVSIVLTPGDWDIAGNIELSNGGAVVTSWFSGGVSCYSGDSYTDYSEGDNLAYGYSLAPAAMASAAVPSWRLQTSAPLTTVFLKGLANFSSGQPYFYGRISARRVR